MSSFSCVCVICSLCLGCVLLFDVSVDSTPFLHRSSVVCLYADVFCSELRWGKTLGVGNPIMMRGGSCAIELCLMVGGVYCVRSGGC